MILNFKNKTQKEINKLIGDGYFFIQEAAKFNKNIEITEVKEKKSHPQLKAIYKLFQLCLPHFQSWKPAMLWDLEEIKEFLKAELGYTRKPTAFEISMMIKQSGFTPKTKQEKEKMVKFCKKINQNISFADFTKEQAYNFVNEIEVWAQTPNEKTNKTAWEDVFLTNAEKEVYYASLEKKII